jgi:hypothetical protein
LNTASSGLACSGVEWSFEQSFVVTIGGTVSLCGLSLCLDGHNRRRGLLIPFAQYHVWDAFDTLLPISTQAAWQALSYVKVNGRNVLLADRVTEFDAPTFKPIIIVAILIIICDLGFLIVRNFLPCVPCRASFVERVDPRQSGRFIAVKLRESDGRKVLQQVPNEALSTFNGLRAVLTRVRTLSIPICTCVDDTPKNITDRAHANLDPNPKPSATAQPATARKDTTRRTTSYRASSCSPLMQRNFCSCWAFRIRGSSSSSLTASSSRCFSSPFSLRRTASASFARTWGAALAQVFLTWGRRESGPP